MKTRTKTRAAAFGTIALLVAGCTATTTVDPNLARGRQQLVDAMDAAWIRVVASGKDRAILAQQPPSRPGAALSYMVTLADCLPAPELAPFPETPVAP